MTVQIAIHFIIEDFENGGASRKTGKLVLVSEVTGVYSIQRWTHKHLRLSDTDVVLSDPSANAPAFAEVVRQSARSARG